MLVRINVFVGIAVLVGGVPVETGMEVWLGVAVLTGVTLATDVFDPVDGECSLGPLVTLLVAMIVLDAITPGAIVGEAVAVGVGVNLGAMAVRSCVTNSVP